MKKFLTFLVSVLFTLSSFGQGSLNLEHMSGTIQKVGDEFVMKIQYYTDEWHDNNSFTIRLRIQQQIIRTNRIQLGWRRTK